MSIVACILVCVQSAQPASLPQASGPGSSALAAQGQGEAQKPVPPPPPAPPSRVEPKLVDESGAQVVPGKLPEATSKPARDAWQRLCEASLAPDAQREPVRAFELDVDIRYKKNDAATNDFKASYKYLAPNFVRTTTASRREQLRGPEGDWLIDRSNGDSVEKKPLGISRDTAEDRRQLDETVSIAQNFVALTDPASLRILSLRVAERAPAVLPQSQRERAAQLSWLELRSPDFHLSLPPPRDATAGARIFRVQLGVDAQTGLVEQALVNEDDAGGGLRPASVMLQLAKYKPVDGFRVPRQILMFSVDETQQPLAFRAEPSSDIFLGAIRLRPRLRPEDFLPR